MLALHTHEGIEMLCPDVKSYVVSLLLMLYDTMRYWFVIYTQLIRNAIYCVGVDGAPVRNMATVDRFQDSDYVNWIKAGQALLCTAEGIYTFCENPIKNYHVTLHRKFPRQPCSGPCRYVIVW